MKIGKIIQLSNKLPMVATEPEAWDERDCPRPIDCSAPAFLCSDKQTCLDKSQVIIIIIIIMIIIITIIIIFGQADVLGQVAGLRRSGRLPNDRS